MIYGRNQYVPHAHIQYAELSAYFGYEKEVEIIIKYTFGSYGRRELTDRFVHSMAY